MLFVNLLYSFQNRNSEAYIICKKRIHYKEAFKTCQKSTKPNSSFFSFIFGSSLSHSSILPSSQKWQKYQKKIFLTRITFFGWKSEKWKWVECFNFDLSSLDSHYVDPKCTLSQPKKKRLDSLKCPYASSFERDKMFWC